MWHIAYLLRHLEEAAIQTKVGSGSDALAPKLVAKQRSRLCELASYLRDEYGILPQSCQLPHQKNNAEQLFKKALFHYRESYKAPLMYSYEYRTVLHGQFTDQKWWRYLMVASLAIVTLVLLPVTPVAVSFLAIGIAGFVTFLIGDNNQKDLRAKRHEEFIGSNTTEEPSKDQIAPTFSPNVYEARPAKDAEARQNWKMFSTRVKVGIVPDINSAQDVDKALTSYNTVKM